MICADDPFHVDLASDVAADAGCRHPDGRRHQRRDGPDRRDARVPPPSSSPAGSIGAPGLRFAGIMGYEGHTLTAWPNEEKLRQTTEAIAGLVESRG